MAQPRLFPEIESPDFRRDEAIATLGTEVLSAHGKVGGPVFDVARAIRDEEVHVLWLRNDKPFDELNEDLTHDAAGKCIKAPGIWRDVTGFDVAIWIRGYWWDKWERRIREAALLHELMHVEVKRDKNGQAKVAVRKHDVEDFTAVAKAYGPIFGDAAAYVRAATVKPVASDDDVSVTVSSAGRSATLDAAAMARLGRTVRGDRVTPDPCPFHGCTLAAEHAGDHAFNEASPA